VDPLDLLRPKRTGFSETDLDLLREALVSMFEQDRIPERPCFDVETRM